MLSACSVSCHDLFLRRCFTIYCVPHLGWWFSLDIGPLNPPSPPASHSWQARGEAAVPPCYLWVWILSFFIAYTHHCCTLLIAPRTWVPRNSRSLEPGLKPKSRRGDMIFQTQPSCWTYVPRLRSREGEGGATGSNIRTLYRTPSLSNVVCLSSQSTLAIYSFWFLHTLS